MSDTIAEMRLPTNELLDDLPFFTNTLGMRLDMIYPADNPSIAVFSGHGLRVRLEKVSAAEAETLSTSRHGALKPPKSVVDRPDMLRYGKARA